MGDGGVERALSDMHVMVGKSQFPSVLHAHKKKWRIAATRRRRRRRRA